MICRIEWLETQTTNIKAIDKASSIDVKNLKSHGIKTITEESYNEMVDMGLSNIEDPDFTCEICGREIVGDIYTLTDEAEIVYEQLCKDCIREIMKHGLEVSDHYYGWER